MCGQCDSLKAQIERAARIIAGGLDATTKTRLETMLRNLEAMYRKQAAICES